MDKLSEIADFFEENLTAYQQPSSSDSPLSGYESINNQYFDPLLAPTQQNIQLWWDTQQLSLPPAMGDGPEDSDEEEQTFLERFITKLQEQFVGHPRIINWLNRFTSNTDTEYAAYRAGDYSYGLITKDTTVSETLTLPPSELYAGYSDADYSYEFITKDTLTFPTTPYADYGDNKDHAYYINQTNSLVDAMAVFSPAPAAELNLSNDYHSALNVMLTAGK